MKKRTKKLLYIEDSNINKMVLEATIELLEEEYNCKIKTTKIELYKVGQKWAVENLPGEVERSDIIVFDYGGYYSIFGSGGFIDWWNRFFISLIKNNSSKDWKCHNALDVFDTDDRSDLENLGVKFKW